MNVIPERYHRNILLFGAEGQRAIGKVAVALVGGGGVGSALAQQLALLGVGRITSIDPEELDETNRNRFVGARTTDVVPGTLKVAIIDRLIRETNSYVGSIPIAKSLLSLEAFDAIRASDWIFGCLDDDGPRAVLNELCAAHGLPYIDLAADVPASGIYGGRVCVAVDGDGCLECLGQLDRCDVRRYFESQEQRDQEDAVYGVPRQALTERGPSVAPLNGVVGGLAATEFMVAVTGLRRPTRLQEYRAWESKVVVNTDLPRPDCPCCKGIRGTGESADVERYLRLPPRVS